MGVAPVHQAHQGFRGSSLLLSVVMIVAGILAIIVPFIAGLAITAAVGWLLIFAGAAHFIFAFRRTSAGNVVWQLLLGILYGAAGFYLLFHPLLGLTSLTLVLGAYLFAEALLEFLMAYELRGFGVRGWLILDGIITLILSVIIWVSWPLSSSWAIGVLVGISILFSGIARLAVSGAHPGRDLPPSGAQG